MLDDIQMLAGRRFVLVDNDGSALANTVMTFEPAGEPLRARYSGPNVILGQALVHASAYGVEMVYHALTTDGDLNAGAARVEVSLAGNKRTMVLRWCWLTGGTGSGTSTWDAVDSK